MKPGKPLYRQPCNGCGMCCLAEQCPMSIDIFGEHDRCPALIDAGNRYACGLIAQPDQYFQPGREADGSRLCGEALGIGTYCDSVETIADAMIAALDELQGKPIGSVP